MSDYQDIELDIADPVAVIRLNRPEKLNAFTHHTLGELRDAVDAAAADPRVVGIVITGNGRGFCAGLDTEALKAVTHADGPPADTPEDSSELPGLFSYLLETPKPGSSLLSSGVSAGEAGHLRPERRGGRRRAGAGAHV